MNYLLSKLCRIFWKTGGSHWKWLSIQSLNSQQKVIKHSIEVKVPKIIKHNNQVKTKAQPRNNTCIYCNKQGHMAGFCTEFISLSHESKVNFIKSKKLCFNCLRPNHNTSECKNPSKCLQCNKKHHTTLHKAYSTPSNSANEQTYPPMQAIQAVRSKTIITSAKKALLATAIVNVKTVSGELIPVRAMLDNGSESSLIRLRLIKKLGIIQKTRKLTNTGNRRSGGSG